MKDNNLIFLLSSFILLLVFFLYKHDKENIRLHNVCADQDETIKLQSDAIFSQKSYISHLQQSYNSLYYSNSQGYNFIPEENSKNSSTH